MRRLAMRKAQHALRVDMINPTRGFVDVLHDSEDVIIASAGNLSIAECEGELRLLASEIAKTNNELDIAKRRKDGKEIERLGLKISSLCSRRSPFKRRVIELRQVDASQILGDAIRKIAPLDIAQAIFAEAKRVQEEQWK